MHRLKLNIPSIIHEVENHGLSFDLFVKREDLIHPLIKGNKYRKLKYNFDLIQGKTVVSFGGAYSNHLHALAALCKEFDVKCVGIVRGDEVNNHVLNFCKSCGMKLQFIDRDSYRLKENSEEVKLILSQYNDVYLIPEGGSNDLALHGVEELVDEIVQQAESYDFIAVAAGTGCTAAGVLKGIKNHKLSTRLIVFSALKGGWMADEISKFSKQDKSSFICTDAYCQGGYAKVNDEYLKVVKTFSDKVNLPIDNIYNGKLIYGLIDLDKKGYFEKGCRVLWLNSGGV